MFTVTCVVHWLWRSLCCTALRKQLLSAYKQIWCWQDEWLGLDLAAVRRMEEETGVYLKRLMHQPQSRAGAGAGAGAGKPSLDHSVSAPALANMNLVASASKSRLQNQNQNQNANGAFASPSAIDSDDDSDTRNTAARSSGANERSQGERAKPVLELTEEDGAEEALEA